MPFIRKKGYLLLTTKNSFSLWEKLLFSLEKLSSKRAEKGYLFGNLFSYIFAVENVVAGDVSPRSSSES